jgi:hypothetical protein
MLWLFFDDRHKIYIITILIVLLGWTYPPVGILFAVIILADCIIAAGRTQTDSDEGVNQG